MTLRVAMVALVVVAGAAAGASRPKLAELSGEQLASIGTDDMNDAIWLELASRVDGVLDGSNVLFTLLSYLMAVVG
jgi:L-asparaginase/Glu-tRNA(Gln) amidotransferase subunit D